MTNQQTFDVKEISLKNFITHLSLRTGLTVDVDSIVQGRDDESIAHLHASTRDGFVCGRLSVWVDTGRMVKSLGSRQGCFAMHENKDLPNRILRKGGGL